MSIEIDVNTDKDGNNIAKDELKSDTETKEVQKEPKSVSFNRDVHVKRFGKPRESRSASSEHQPPTRKEPFTHLSEQELIDEANKVLAQAQSVTCTADHPPDKFFSLPHRRKFKEQLDRRNSDEGTTEDKKTLGRSTSDVSQKKRKERTSLSTLFRKSQKSKLHDAPLVITTKPVTKVQRSKSDVSDLKSNTSLNTQTKPVRKRSGSETEEFLKSLRNKKNQLSPIIESSPRDDYFNRTPPLEAFQKKKLSIQNSDIIEDNSSKINPLEKPPRYKSPDKEPKPPIRIKRGKSAEKQKEQSPQITNTPKRKVDVKKTLLVDEIDSIRGKDIKPAEVKDRIKSSIKKLEENIYGTKDMIHSSQKPPEKPPLTRGHTVDHIVRILREDQLSPPPKTHLVTPYGGSNINQPFSYTKPSLSPDPNIFTRSKSPDRVPSPVNKMTDKGVVYAQVVRENGEKGVNGSGKQTIHKTYSPSAERYGNLSDEDEGLGYEDRYKISSSPKNNNNFKLRENNNSKNHGTYKVTDSPIRPRFREYKLTSFTDFEPTYANEYPTNEDHSQNYIDTTLRGRADGMDTKKKPFIETEPKLDLDFNELSHRRHLLESRLNARRQERDKINTGEPLTRYLAEKDPIYEANKRMEATEKYVNETARYYRHTLERDGVADSSVTEDYNKFDLDNRKSKYNTESRTVQKTSKGAIDRREFLDSFEPRRYPDEPHSFPPEPEYEPPSLEFNTGKPILSPIEYTEKKYKVKSKHFTSSQDVLQNGQKYKKDDYFVKRKGHYASNPEINQEPEDDYANTRYDPKHPEAYHNSLKREKNKDKYYKENYGIRRHDSGDSRDYYRDEKSPRRFEFDNRLVDSGIENDFRKDSSGEIHRSRYRRSESDDDVRNTSMLLASERQHTEDNYPSEQLYANGEYITRFESTIEYPTKEYIPRERSADDGSHFSPTNDKFDKSPNRFEDKVSAKPPKANKKLSGLEKVKQLFSRDSSKKSKKEKEVVQPKPRTRVLKSPEHLAEDPGYRRYKDPEPSDDERRKDYREYGIPRDDDRYRHSDQRDSDPERYRSDYNRRKEERSRASERNYREHRIEERRRYGSSDRESDHRSPRPSDAESDMRREPQRKTRSKTTDPLDSPALAERYRERRRLATPSPTPSPPLRAHPASPPQNSAVNWFKSLDRLTRKRGKNTKVEKENGAATEDESTTRKTWSKPTKPLNSPAKNLRFFGDTDQDSDANTKHSTLVKTKSHPIKSHTLLRKTTSNSSTGLDEVDRSVLSNKSSSLSNLREEKEDARTKQYYKRNLHNISEIHSNSETESNFGRKVAMKPPISPYDRSRSHSSSKTLKGSKNDVRRLGSRELRSDERGSSSELRSSRQEINRDGNRHRRRTPVTHSGESSTEGESSHQSQKSVVFLHATTVGDIPDPGVLARNRSRDDVSSVNSSNLQIRTTQKSFSIFAPWTPRHYNEQHDLHYAQKPRKPKPKEPLKKYSSAKNLADERNSTLQKKKSYSQTTLNRRPQNNRLSSSNTTLYRKTDKRNGKENDSDISTTISRSKNKKSQSNEGLSRDSDRDRISRSISMPKDKNKKAAWFNLSNKNKKQEINTRVR